MGSGINIGLGTIPDQGDKFVKRKDAGSARIHDAGYPLVNTNRIGVAEAKRAVGMDMDIDPARR